MAEQEEAATPSSGEAELAAAIEKVRNTALWLIGAFGAIGAAVAAALPFSDIGKLAGIDAVLASAGIIAAFFGVGAAIVAVSSLLLPRARTLAELRRADSKDPAVKRLAATPELLLPLRTLKQLQRERNRLNDAYARSYAQWVAEPDKDNAGAVDAWAAAGQITQATLARVIAWANYETLLADYRHALRRWVLPGLLLTAAGLLLFAVNVTDTPTPAPAAAPEAQLDGADLSKAMLSGIDLGGASLAEASLAHADLSEADLSGADLSEADLSGTNLRAADLTDANLADAVWAGTTCPDGTNSDDVGETCEAHLSVPEDATP